MEKTFYIMCRRICIQAEYFLQKQLKGTELTPAQCGLLLNIMHNAPDGTTLTELHRRTGLTKSSLSTMVKTLLGKGFLKTECDAGDRRVKKLVLTPKARRAGKAMHSAEQKLDIAFLRLIGEEKFVAVCRALEAVETKDINSFEEVI